MDVATIDMHSLFAQLGQDSDEAGIACFIRTYGPLAGDIRLDEAQFWTPAQASFLREAIQQDADWAVVVDELNVQLHGGWGGQS